MEEEYNMADDVKLLLPAVETEQLSTVEVVVRTNAKVITALNSKTDEANAQLSRHANKAEVIDDSVRADAEAHDEDVPINLTADAGDENNDNEDDDNEDDDDSPSRPDARKDLDGDDDEDDNDNDFTIHLAAKAFSAPEEDEATEIGIRSCFSGQESY
ncbi:uncharacterized protein LOC112518263 [Cynara cardunculus var. scolymus]|uniref:uncharacterized protein LOC112518263 n=1 Tax=Cynara cardunculus var. scolymus TaxID=59895 RepID=UPI000D62A7A3|nr:uncharacterized protein LOC112518263 [Cynara cardunculus var. scolymus]